MPRRSLGKNCLNFLLVALPVAVLTMFLLQHYNNQLMAEGRRALQDTFDSDNPPVKVKVTKDQCAEKKACPEDQFSFFLQSGAANVIPAKICLQNKVIIGGRLNNAGTGMNMAVMNSKTGQVTKKGSFDMYAGEIQPLIDFVKSIDDLSVLLIATYDEPASKLNEEARKLLAEFGSAAIKDLGFRDNWVFVGRKGAAGTGNFEKHIRNDGANNKYDNWPEIINIQGCIPKNLE